MGWLSITGELFSDLATIAVREAASMADVAAREAGLGRGEMKDMVSDLIRRDERLSRLASKAKKGDNKAKSEFWEVLDRSLADAAKEIQRRRFERS